MYNVEIEEEEVYFVVAAAAAARTKFSTLKLYNIVCKAQIETRVEFPPGKMFLSTYRHTFAWMNKYM